MLRVYAEGLLYFNLEVHPLDIDSTRKIIGSAAKSALCLHPSASTTEALRFLGWPEPETVSTQRQCLLLLRMLASPDINHRKLMRFALLCPAPGGSWRQRLENGLCKLMCNDSVFQPTFWQSFVSFSPKDRRTWMQTVFSPIHRVPHVSVYHCAKDAWRVFRFFSYSLIPFERDLGEHVCITRVRKSCELCGSHPASGRSLIRSCAHPIIVDIVNRVSSHFLSHRLSRKRRYRIQEKEQ